MRFFIKRNIIYFKGGNLKRVLNDDPVAIIKGHIYHNGLIFYYVKLTNI